MAGGLGLLVRIVGGGIVLGGVVCILTPEGGGGTRGSFSGKPSESDVGLAGAKFIAPGGSGVGSVAVWL